MRVNLDALKRYTFLPVGTTPQRHTTTKTVYQLKINKAVSLKGTPTFRSDALKKTRLLRRRTSSFFPREQSHKYGLPETIRRGLASLSANQQHSTEQSPHDTHEKKNGFQRIARANALMCPHAHTRTIVMGCVGNTGGLGTAV